MTERMRVDRLLVERGLFESRAQAQAAIAAGLVVANEAPVTKASQELAADAVLRAEPAQPYVSRGGVKLAAALDHFGFDPAGRVCLDVGASTGGFTDVLLARGAATVYAVDVGKAQLHGKLRDRPEVVVLEATDIRSLAPGRLAPPPTLVVVDVSFISLKLVLPAALRLAQPPARLAQTPARLAQTPAGLAQAPAGLAQAPAWLIALIKPQFEAGRAEVNRHKGVIRDPQVHAAVTEDVTGAVAALGWRVLGLVPSPVLGREGNREFLLGAVRD